MPAGLQVFDEQGQDMFNTNSRVCRLLGTFETGLANGSFVVSQPVSGEIFFFGVPASRALFGSNVPGLSSSGSAISWVFAGAANRISMTVFYGER